MEVNWLWGGGILPLPPVAGRLLYPGRQRSRGHNWHFVLHSRSTQFVCFPHSIFHSPAQHSFRSRLLFATFLLLSFSPSPLFPFSRQFLLRPRLSVGRLAVSSKAASNVIKGVSRLVGFLTELVEFAEAFPKPKNSVQQTNGGKNSVAKHCKRVVCFVVRGKRNKMPKFPKMFLISVHCQTRPGTFHFTKNTMIYATVFFLPRMPFSAL